MLAFTRLAIFLSVILGTILVLGLLEHATTSVDATVALLWHVVASAFLGLFALVLHAYSCNLRSAYELLALIGRKQVLLALKKAATELEELFAEQGAIERRCRSLDKDRAFNRSQDGQRLLQLKDEIKRGKRIFWRLRDQAVMAGIKDLPRKVRDFVEGRFSEGSSEAIPTGAELLPKGGAGA